MVLLHNLPRDVKTQAHSLTDVLRGKKWLKKLRLNFFSHSRTIISNGDDGLVFSLQSMNPDVALRLILQDLSNIDEEIKENLPHLIDFTIDFFS